MKIIAPVAPANNAVSHSNFKVKLPIMRCNADIENKVMAIKRNEIIPDSLSILINATFCNIF